MFVLISVPVSMGHICREVESVRWVFGMLSLRGRAILFYVQLNVVELLTNTLVPIFHINFGILRRLRWWWWWRRQRCWWWWWSVCSHLVCRVLLYSGYKSKMTQKHQIVIVRHCDMFWRRPTNELWTPTKKKMEQTILNAFSCSFFLLKIEYFVSILVKF